MGDNVVQCLACGADVDRCEVYQRVIVGREVRPFCEACYRARKEPGPANG